MAARGGDLVMCSAVTPSSPPRSRPIIGRPAKYPLGIGTIFKVRDNLMQWNITNYNMTAWYFASGPEQEQKFLLRAVVRKKAGLCAKNSQTVGGGV